MSAKRFFTVAWADVKENLTRPIFWFWVAILAFLSWGMSTGHVRIASGDSAVGGTKAWFTSQFAIAQFFSMTVLILDAFFLAVLAGMAVPRDEEIKIMDLLHSTPLRSGEYVYGKFIAVIATGLFVLVLNVVALAVSNHLVPNAQAEEIRGPFQLWNYLGPMLWMALPPFIFVAGVAFMIGVVTRRPILVFLFPVALLLIGGFFLWDWSPSWLSLSVNRFLQVIEPGGFRWMNETWLKVDKGVEYYNHQPVQFDAIFALNRLWTMLVGLIAVAVAEMRFRATLLGHTPAPAKARGKRGAPVQPNAPVPDLDDLALGGAAGTPVLSSLRMSTSRPGLVAGIRSVLRFEWTELWSSPGLYLFTPIILIQILGSTLVAVGAFDTPLLVTSGTVAVRAMNTITFLVSLLLLFYTVESLRREEGSGLAGIYFSTPVRTASMLFGKAVANSLVGVVVVLAAFLGCAIAILIQGRVRIELGPFLLVWGLLLVPTFLVWSSFVGMIYAVARNRYTAYGVGFGVLMLTFALQFTNKMTWAGNWNLWGVLNWSDLGPIEMDRPALFWNRLGALGLTVLFTAITVRAFPRREPDATRIVHALRPGSFWRGALRLSPYAVVPIVCVIALVVLVRGGFQGKWAEKKEKDYWVQNLATWKDAPEPSIRLCDAAVDLDPEKHSFRTEGRFVLYNHHEKPMRQFALTGGLHWQDLEWTMNGEAVKPEDRTHLFVFTPPTPLAPNDSLELGFKFHGVYPKGSTRNGRGASEFILPSGVVLTYIGSPSFLPSIGYIESVGVTDKNRYEPRVYPPDYYKERLDPAFGSATPGRTRIAVSGPAEYTYNSVGVLVSDETVGGKRTMTWQSDYPVRFWNVVAGKWAVKRGEGTAIYYSPKHPYNVDEMSAALDASRKYYSEWFRPFPWAELKLSEFPAMAAYAQGFPTNITFSEGIGFLTKSSAKSRIAFAVTAHEAAHQWWGNLLTPANGPGGDILSEGMAHFSTALLHQQVYGEQARIEFLRLIENRYGDNRQADSERPLVKIDGSKPGDNTVTYDKGGWVMWMLYNLMGRDACLAGLQEFMRRFGNGPDYPLLEDLLLTLREYAPDREAFDAFTKQWYFEVVVPEYRIADAKVRPLSTDTASNDTASTDTLVTATARYEVTGSIKNRGSGRMTVEVAAVRGERFPKEGKAPETPYEETRATLILAAGEEQTFTIRTPFEPKELVVDPDARVLMLNRKLATTKL